MKTFKRSILFALLTAGAALAFGAPAALRRQVALRSSGGWHRQ